MDAVRRLRVFDRQEIDSISASQIKNRTTCVELFHKCITHIKFAKSELFSNYVYQITFGVLDFFVLSLLHQQYSQPSSQLHS